MSNSPVTDPAILKQLEGGAPAGKPVTDPKILAQLEGPGGDVGPATLESRRFQPNRGTTDNSLDFVTGNINKGIAGLAGMPVDTARNAANLGIAAYGTAKGAMGGNPPNLIPPGPGSSEWFQNMLTKGGMIGPSAEPTSKLGEYGAAALQMAPSALAGRPMNPAQGARAVGGAMLGGMTGQAAADVGGEEWRGIGAMAPGAKKVQQKTPGERATLERQGETYGKAKDMGIPVPPKAMKPDPAQQAIADQINKELGQPPGTEISPEILKQYNAQHWGDYESLIKAPELKNGMLPNKKFQVAIKEIGNKATEGAKEFPKTFKTMKQVTDLLEDYKQGKTIPADITVRAIKKLRSDATTNIAGEKPEQKELGLAQRKVAMALEGLIEDSLKTPELLAQYREARTAIAKSHDVQSSLDPVTRKVDPSRLSALLTEGRPLTGKLESLAEVSGAFPGAVRTPEEQSMFSSRMSPYGVVHPGAVGAHLATRWHDMPTLTNSRLYQDLFVDPRNKMLTPDEQRMRYLMGALAGSQQRDIPPAP